MKQALVYVVNEIPELDAPANLTGSNTLVKNAQLSWQAVASADHYEIFRDGQSIGTTTTLSFTDTATLDGTYGYTVRAVNANGASSIDSNTVGIEVDGVAPVTSIVNPAPSQTMSGTFNFYAEIADSHQRRHYIAIYKQNGQLVKSYSVNNPTTSSFEYQWDSTTVPNGKYRVEVSAIDALNTKDAGSTKNVWFFVQN